MKQKGIMKLTCASCILLIELTCLLTQPRLGASSGLLEPPIVINTWNFTSANEKAWEVLSKGRSAIDAVEKGCSQCEIDRCDGTVGWGGSPSEIGETTLDAMIMDGESYDVGAVAGLRRIKSAISVARKVLEHTEHTLLVGEMATQFAIGFGFKEESLTSNESKKMISDWRAAQCQPNYWKNVEPDPKTSCGPYKPLKGTNKGDNRAHLIKMTNLIRGHDTIGMISMDARGRLASGTSTNGLKYKISGRVGDSPVPGAGSYAAKEAGAAAATGDGDVIMRFLLSYQAVENLRLGMSTKEAALNVIERQVNRTGRPYPQAAVIVLDLKGNYGAACSGFKQFPYVISDLKKQVQIKIVNCLI